MTNNETKSASETTTVEASTMPNIHPKDLRGGKILRLANRREETLLWEPAPVQGVRLSLVAFVGASLNGGEPVTTENSEALRAAASADPVLSNLLSECGPFYVLGLNRDPSPNKEPEPASQEIVFVDLVAA